MYIYIYLHMYMYMCMYVCIYMYMYICVYLHVYIYICIHMYIYIYIGMFNYIYVYFSISLSTPLHSTPFYSILFCSLCTNTNIPRERNLSRRAPRLNAFFTPGSFATCLSLVPIPDTNPVGNCSTVRNDVNKPTTLDIQNSSKHDPLP